MTVTNHLIFTADPEFVDLALEELYQNAPDATVIATLAPGVLLVRMAQPFIAFAERWQQQPPIFVRHICPAQWFVPLHAAQETDLAALLALVLNHALPLVDPDLALSVQTRIFARLPYKPYDVNTTLADALLRHANVAINVRAPQQVFSVVCAGMPATDARGEGTSDQLSALLGLSLAAHNLSDWAGGVHRFAREEGQISRAEFKLLEAFAVFQINLPPHGVALDLGAAPGGWTRVLRQYEQYVTAVDPAELDPRVAHDPNVRHKQMTAESYLADDPDEFDVIVNDLRMDARDSARLMVAYARQLYSHGFAVMTLKLSPQERRQVIDQTFTILRRAYKIVGARQLFHNRSEITLFLKPVGRK